MIARSIALFCALLVAAQADTLILKDGTNVKGRWWSLDASQVHFLVNNQLQHYPRSEVSAVTFGDSTLPAPPTPAPAPSKTAAAPAAAPPAQAAPPPAVTPPRAQAPPSLAHPPSLERPTLARSAPAAAPTAAAAPSGGSTEPQQVGVVYFKSASGELTPLEPNQAVERRRGNTQYFEMPKARSPVRVKSAPTLVFVVRLPDDADPHTYSLYPLVTANNTRRTEPQPGRIQGPVTLPFDINKVRGSTYTFTIADLADGEYSFSPTTSNDGYCFGVDQAAGR